MIHAAERWKIQFFYDKPDSVLQISDLQCPSAKHCVAAGLIVDKNGREKGTMVVTADGGPHWSLQEVGEHPSVAFPAERFAGLDGHRSRDLVTEDSGQTWKKLDGLQRDPARVLPESGAWLRHRISQGGV